MPSFSNSSLQVLDTCHHSLQELFLKVVQTYDCQALVGARSEAEEQKAIDTGHSKLKNPMESKHVIGPGRPLSEALDAAPFPVIWPEINMQRLGEYVHTVGRFYHFAGYVLSVASELHIPIRWGGDWNRDLIFTDQTFDDLDHFEVIV